MAAAVSARVRSCAPVGAVGKRWDTTLQGEEQAEAVSSIPRFSMLSWHRTCPEGGQHSLEGV